MGQESEVDQTRKLNRRQIQYYRIKTFHLTSVFGKY